MNIIIVGCGNVGKKIAQSLSGEKDNNVTVVDTRLKATQETARQCDVMGVVGSGTNVDILSDAGVENADILIAVTGSDEENLMTCFLAKKLGNCQTIARVRKPEYKKSVGLFVDDFGLAMIINPELTAATEMARVLRFPSAIQIDTFAKERVEILKFKVSDNSVLNKFKVSDIVPKLNCNVLVCGVERGENAFIPRGDFVLNSGDLVSIVASPENSARFFSKIGVKTNSVKDTIIVGGGETGYYLARILLKHGIKVKIIEQSEARCEELCGLLPKATIINADGTDKTNLLEENIQKAESCVALTNIDEENILLSLFAKSQGVGKVITKINKISYDEVISKLDLDTIMYPKNLTAEHIVRFVRAKKNSIGSDIETMHFVLDGKAEALEFKIKGDSPLIGTTIENLKIKKKVLIASIYRNGEVIIPRGKDNFMDGDSVIVVTTLTGLQNIEDILE